MVRREEVWTKNENDSTHVCLIGSYLGRTGVGRTSADALLVGNGSFIHRRRNIRSLAVRWEISTAFAETDPLCPGEARWLDYFWKRCGNAEICVALANNYVQRSIKVCICALYVGGR